MGVKLSDAAQVTGGDNPTGTVTFKLFGPNDSACSGPALMSNVVNLNAGAATSGSYATSAAGSYSWTALYSGDAHNGDALSGCGSEDVIVTVASAVKGVTTTPTPKPTATPTATPTAAPIAVPTPKPAATHTATPKVKPTGKVKAATTPTTPTTPNTGVGLFGPLALFLLGAVLLGLAAVVRRRPTFSS